MGYTLQEIKAIDDSTVEDFKFHNYYYPYEKREPKKYTLKEIRAGGYSCKDVKDVGYTCGEANAAGYSLREMKAAGYSLREIIECTTSIGGCKRYSCKDVKDVGYTCKEAKAAGYPLWAIKAAGYSLQEIKAAGYYCDEAVQGAPSGLQPGTSEEYTVPHFTFEELESCEQLGGDRAYRLRADLKRCLTTKGTGIKVAPDMLTFRAKEVGYELMYRWPQPIDETRATTKFSKKDRELTVVAPLLRQ